MQNATRPGFTPPQVAPVSQIPSMPFGYAAPPPAYMYTSPAAKSINNVGGALFKRGLQLTITILFLLLGIYLFFKTDTGKGILDTFKQLIPIVEVLGVITGGAYIYKFGARQGLFGKARKTEQLAEDAKVAREAGDLKKAEELEKEAQEVKAETEGAEGAAAAAEGAEGAAAVAEASEGAEGLAEFAEVARFF